MKLNRDIDEVMSAFLDLQKQLSSFEKDEDRENFIFNNYVVFNEAFKIIKQQIKDGDYCMYYQPQIGMDGKWQGAEALFRMQYNGKPLYPDVVFSLANFFGIDRGLTLILLDRVCKDMKRINAEINSNIFVSFNIDCKLIDAEFVQKIIRIVEYNKINPRSLGIELTEISSFDEIRVEDIETLKSSGFSLLIDDFGAGYANESLVMKLPFDVVKFSEKLVTDIDKPEKNLNYERVKKVMQYCKDNGIKTVAEHVETKEELNTIRELGIDKVQGWYYFKAMNVEQFIEKYGSSRQC